MKGNLVGVVAPTEWEAISAAQSLAATTKWTDWKGLPGHAQAAHVAAREGRLEVDARSPRATRTEATSAPALGSAARTLTASYELPYMKHAPIGPTIAVGDVQAGRHRVRPHAQPEPAGAARPDRDDARHAGRQRRGPRSTPGRDTTADRTAATPAPKTKPCILSKAVGRPVRVQWMRPEDLQWSTQSPAAFSDIRIGLDAQGKITAYEADHYMPAMQDDRLVGAIIAGLPDAAGARRRAPSRSARRSTSIQDPWIYESGANVAEAGPRHVPARPEANRRSASAFAITACGRLDSSSRTSRASSPSARRRRSPASIRSSSACSRPTTRASIGVLKAVREASGWQSASVAEPKRAQPRARRP